MAEQESFVRFEGEAAAFYQNLVAIDEVVGLWEQLLYIADENQVDDENILDFPLPDEMLKILYGPPFTILFDNLLNGKLVIYSLHRTGF